MIHQFNAPQTIIHGAGASKELLNQLKRLSAKRVLFVTDIYIESTGLVQNLAQPLIDEGISVAIFSGVQPDPTVQNVQDGLKLLNAQRADTIVAVGGGSPIDAAKAISILTSNPEPLTQYLGYHKIAKAGLPLIAIPTTAGTGSEATKVTVITDTDQNVKMMILDSHLMPTVALVDYELTLSMPQSLTAYVGVDTLTHGIEAYVSRKANAITDPIALSCIDLVSKYLYQSWENSANLVAREGMSMAACQGGLAFTNSSVCLVHGMSRPLGVQFHLAHGLSNAILLPAVTRFSVPGAISRYAKIARIMELSTLTDTDEVACEKLIKGLEDLNKVLKVPKLRECVGIQKDLFEDVLEKMACDALASGSPQNNPIVPSIEQIIEIYKQAW
jgi:alcohol dehydrogenase